MNMNIANVLANEPDRATNQAQSRPDGSQLPSQPLSNPHQYPTRQALSQSFQLRDDGYNLSITPGSRTSESRTQSEADLRSPSSAPPKNVAFELLIDENTKARARIPMRVQIFPHDTTDSIVTTVKNFYGLYEGAADGVSFEDENGNTLIARYENLWNNMTVFVRIISNMSYEQNGYGSSYYGRTPVDAPRGPTLGEPFQMSPPQSGHVLDHTQPPSRPMSRVTRKRSLSPNTNRGRRSASLHKAQSRPEFRSRASSAHGSFADGNSDAINGYSDSDGGHGSVTSSRKSRSEQMTSADISQANILQEGRRKRAKFESSELPLFAPPQVPLTTSSSSISPQRRSVGNEGPSPFARPAQRLSYPALASPYSYVQVDRGYVLNTHYVAPYAPPPGPQHGHRLRDRPNTLPYASHNGHRILPTPDPTVASCISDEDVALQLMRLGDASNISHGRTSASTFNDDAFSGVADAASSTGATSDLDEEIDHGRPDVSVNKHYQVQGDYQSYDNSDASGDEADGYDEVDDVREELASDEYDDYASSLGRPMPKKLKSHGSSNMSATSRGGKSSKAGKPSKSRFTNGSKRPKHAHSAIPSKGPVLPNSIPSQSRKTSSASTLNFQHQLAADEEDLSSKPRCRRCRKSKKGCDRQRPCQRCKDAGIGFEGCLSEEEENGRKGRYGRHMGVPVKKEGPLDGEESQNIGAILTGMSIPPAQITVDKSKKRKR